MSNGKQSHRETWEIGEDFGTIRFHESKGELTATINFPESPEETMKQSQRAGARSERLAQPKVFGAASCAGHAIHRSHGSTVLGGGGTSDLDTNRGPPIQTPNAKNSTRVYARTFTLSKFFVIAGSSGGAS